MFRPWKTTLREAGSPRSRRDRRRFVPTLSGSLSQLEDRVVLSAAAHAAAVAHKAAVLAGTHAGRVVTGLYESILATKPSDTQLIKGVAEVRQGHEKALRNQLVKAAQMEHAPVAAKTMVTVSVTAAGSSTPITSFSKTFTGASLTPAEINDVTQLAAQNFRAMSVALASPGTGGPHSLSVSTTRTIGTTGTTTTVTSTNATNAGTITTTVTTTTGTPPTTTTTPTTTTSSTTPTTTTTTTSTAAALVQAVLLALEGVATPVTALGPTNTSSITSGLGSGLSQLGLSSLALGSLPLSMSAITPLTLVNSPVNPSPVLNPFPTVRSPINSSPVLNPLPAGNSPINPSPIGQTFPAGNSPINGSPIGTLPIVTPVSTI